MTDQRKTKRDPKKTLEEDEEAIKEEFMRDAPYTRNKIDEIYKMKQHSIIKVKFNDIDVAERVKKEGVKLFYCTNIPENIEFERYIPVTQCMKCYSYEHTKNKCTV